MPSKLEKSQPEHLYHYSDAGALVGILQSKELHLSSIRALNDSEEYEGGLKFLRTQIEQQCLEVVSPNVGVVIRGLLDFCESTDDPMISPGHRLHVFSLSEKPDDLSQWRAYGHRGDGFCIEFRRSSIAQGIRDGKTISYINSSSGAPLYSKGISLEKCLYFREEKMAVANMVCDEIVKMASKFTPKSKPSEADARKFNNDVFRLIAKNACTFKHQAFAAEAEWRVLASYPPAGNAAFKFLTNSGTVRQRLRIRIPVESVTSVMIGPTSEPEIARIGVENLLQYEGLHSTPVLDSSIPYRST